MIGLEDCVSVEIQNLIKYGEESYEKKLKTDCSEKL